MHALKIMITLCVLAATTAVAPAQAPRGVKTGYEVKGHTCYLRLSTGRMIPLPCDSLRLVFIDTNKGGE